MLRKVALVSSVVIDDSDSQTAGLLLVFCNAADGLRKTLFSGITAAMALLVRLS